MSQTTKQQHEARVEWLETPHGRVHVLKGGSGAPLVLLHRDTGPTPWGEFESRLAEHFSLSVPTLPGYGESDRPAWMRTTQEMAVITGHIIDRLADGPCAVVGLGFGGWVAAELSALSPARLSSLALVSPMGLKPPDGGEILDQFLFAAVEYARYGFADDATFHEFYGEEPTEEQVDHWELSREMTTRIAWKPYMFSLSLPYMLRHVQLPTLVIWGEADRVTPPSCGRRFVESMADAELHVLAKGGHQVELEQPSEVADQIISFVESR